MNFIVDHWGWIAGAVAATASAAVHAYQIVVNAGGFYSIRDKFLYGNPASLTGRTAQTQPAATAAQTQKQT